MKRPGDLQISETLMLHRSISVWNRVVSVLALRRWVSPESDPLRR